MMEQNPARIIKNVVENLSKNVKFTAGEIAVFKEALCDIAEKINESSNRSLKASKLYFLGSIILTAVIAFSALIQAGVIKF